MCYKMTWKRPPEPSPIQGRKDWVHAILDIGSNPAAKIVPGRTHHAPPKLAMEAVTRNTSAEVTLPGIVAQIAAGRATAFLASDEASYGTGESLHVEGGWAGK